MNKESNVVNFYVLCNRLKDIIRTGWKNWGVERSRVESVAEHVYGTQMLAISMWSEYKYDIDIYKVITMLAVHEMEEIIIGDLTRFEIDPESKRKLGAEAIEKIFAKLSNAEKLKDLIFEFAERKTPEAKFAYYCDKLECDIQVKLYDEQKCVDLSKQENNKSAENGEVKALLKSKTSWSDMWISFDQLHYNYDDNFTKVSNYIKENDILKEQKIDKK